jgi:hypothetical protein
MPFVDFEGNSINVGDSIIIGSHAPSRTGIMLKRATVLQLNLDEIVAGVYDRRQTFYPHDSKRIFKEVV